jgi:hypothetical protein
MLYLLIGIELTSTIAKHIENRRREGNMSTSQNVTLKKNTSAASLTRSKRQGDDAVLVLFLWRILYEDDMLPIILRLALVLWCQLSPL